MYPAWTQKKTIAEKILEDEVLEGITKLFSQINKQVIR